jgi:ATP-dependent Clp protease ATP-binding subunit ClpC
VKRAVAQSFRPEFVNRLDKVIVFRPLTRERMRGILRKELARVLERRGLKNREWAVEWESSAQEFLLEKGFTADMGARPLKRAIDHYLLAPLAATLVERRFPTGDQFLFVRSDGQAIQVEFVDPNAEEGVVTAVAATEGASDAGALAAAMLQPSGTRAERELLQAQLARIEAAISGAEMNRLRETLTAQMAAPDFWERADRQRCCRDTRSWIACRRH